MRLLNTLLVLIMFSSLEALAEPCGNVTFEGECMGNTLRYCSEGELIEVDCVVEYTANSVCTELDPSYGFGCAVGVGEDCYFEDEAQEIYVVPCQGSNPGCLEDADNATCVENLGPCTEAQTETCTSDGKLIMLCPEFKQPNLLDCVSLGGICSPGKCEQIPAGGYCDDVYAFCADGLVCGESGCESQTTPPVDAGTDAGVTDRGISDVMSPVRPDVGFGFPTNPDASMASANPRPVSSRASESSCSCSMQSSYAQGTEISWVLLVGLCAFCRRRSVDFFKAIIS